MDTSHQWIAINCGGGGYIPGPNAVVTGAVLAGSRLSTEIDRRGDAGATRHRDAVGAVGGSER
jgi:hypothetical protein